MPYLSPGKRQTQLKIYRMKPKIKALLNQISSGKLKTDMARVLYYIKTHPYTTLPEIERKLFLKHETASARVSDLLDIGIIEEQGVKKTVLGHYTYFKFQPDIRAQEANSAERKFQKFKIWRNKWVQFEEFIAPSLKKELSTINK
jgi:predicted DNA-binding transcriptional regulator